MKKLLLTILCLTLVALVFISGCVGPEISDETDPGIIPADAAVSGSCTVIVTDSDTGYTQTGFIDENGVVHYV